MEASAAGADAARHDGSETVHSNMLENVGHVPGPAHLVQYP
jgi:hypothetical protein